MKFKFLLLITITLILLGSRAQTNTTNTTATNTTTTANTTTNTTGTNTTTNTSTTTNTTTNTTTGTNTSTNTTGGASTTGTVTIDTSVPNNCSNPLFTAAAFTYYGMDRPKYLSTAATATGLKACKAFEGKSSCCDATTTTDILASYNKWKTATLANLTSYAHSLKIAFNAFLQVNTMVPSANNASLTVAIKARINNLQFFMIDVNKNMASCAQASFQNVAEFLCLGCHPSWGKWVKGNSLLLSPNTCTKLSTNCQPLITNLGRLKNIARIADRDIIDLIAKYAGVQYDSVDSAISTSTIADTSTLTRRRRILQTTTTNTTVNTTTNTTGTNTTTNTSTTTNTTTNTTGTNTTTNTSTNTTGGASTTGFSDACTKLTSVVGEGKLVSCVVCASASSDAKCANNQFLNTPVSSWPSDRQVVPIVAYYKNDAKSDRYRTWMFYDTTAETKLHTEFTNLVATKPAAAVTALYIRVDAVQPTLVKQAALLSKQQDAAAAAKSGTAGSTGTTAQLRSAASLRSIQSVSLFESMYGTVIAKLNYDVRTSGGVFTCTAASTCQLCYDVAKTSCNTTQKPSWTAAVTIVLNCSNSICTECLSNSTGFTCFSYSMPNPDGTTITSLNNDTVGANYAYQASVPALRLYSNGTGLRIPAEIALPTNVFNLTYFKYTAPCTDDASCKTWLCNNMFKGPVINANKLTNPQDSNADLWGNAGVATATGRRFLEQRQLADAVSANTQDSNGVDYSSGAMAGSDMDQNATVDGVTPTTDSATAQSQIGYNYTGNFAGGSTNTNGGGNNTVTGDSSNGKVLTAFGAMFAVIFVALI